jgi:DNA invertase Pin-like site-specific DNA recombinase
MSQHFTLSETERARIAAQYGCVKVPEAVTVVPRGMSGLPDPYAADSWKASMKRTYDNLKAARTRNIKAATARRVEERANVTATLVAEGVTVKDLSEKLGISERAVRMRLQKMGLEAKAAEPKVSKVQQAAADRRERFAKAVADGMSRADLCKTFGLSADYLRKYADSIGVKFSKANARLNKRKDGAVPKPPTWHKTPEVIARRAKVKELYEGGMSAGLIVRTFGMSPKTVARDLEAMGVERRDKPNLGAREERAAKIVEMRKAGVPWEEICKVLGCTRKHIQDATQAAGIARVSLPPEVQSQRIVELFKAGKSRREIARTLRVAYITIRKELAGIAA